MSRYQPFLPRSTIRVRAQDDKEQTARAGGGIKSFKFWLRPQEAEDPLYFSGAEARGRRLQSSVLRQICMTSLNPEAVRESDLRKCEAIKCSESND